MTAKTELYLSHLWEIGRTTIDDLQEEDLCHLTSAIINEMATKHIPSFESLDSNREIVLMMSEWMQSECDLLGKQILNKIKELIIASMTNKINNQMQYYAMREQESFSQLEHNQLQNAAFDNQRERV